MALAVDVAALGASLVACFGTALLGGWWTRRNLGWYEGIRKPAWTPPGRLIGAVWTVLYTLMASAAWLAWRDAGGMQAAAMPLALFGVQLVLNAAWSGLFFGRHDPGAAFADVVLLWLAIAATAWTFASVSPFAALLMAPYLAWVSFAALLNLAIWRMNPRERRAGRVEPTPR